MPNSRAPSRARRVIVHAGSLDAGDAAGVLDPRGTWFFSQHTAALLARAGIDKAPGATTRVAIAARRAGSRVAGPFDHAGVIAAGTVKAGLRANRRRQSGERRQNRQRAQPREISALPPSDRNEPPASHCMLFNGGRKASATVGARPPLRTLQRKRPPGRPAGAHPNPRGDAGPDGSADGRTGRVGNLERQTVERAGRSVPGRASSVGASGGAVEGAAGRTKSVPTEAPFKRARAQQVGRVLPQRLRKGIAHVAAGQPDIGQHAVVQAGQDGGLAAVVVGLDALAGRPRRSNRRKPARPGRRNVAGFKCLQSQSWHVSKQRDEWAKLALEPP